MICEHCRREATNSAHICPHCGSPLRPYSGQSGIAAMRQGRAYMPPPVYGYTQKPDAAQADAERSREGASTADRSYAADAGRPQNKRGLNRQDARSMPQHARKKGDRPHPVKVRGVNRALLITILLSSCFVAAITLFILAIRTTPGHLLLMRAVQGDEAKENSVVVMIGEESAAKALWVIGTELIDQGYIDRSIETYQRAYELYPDIDNLYERLLSLAEAYEAGGRVSDAEGVYHMLYTKVDKKNPLAYRYAITIMMDQERLFEATDLMKTAHEMTGEMSFKSQRDQLVPLTPTASLQAGSHELERDTELLSSQDYDIYYLINDMESELPEGGILYDGPIHLPEGVHTIRAVCVSSSLVSDEVTFRYNISLPTPRAPKSRLAPGEYERPQRIYLYTLDKDGKQSTLEKENVTVYYTLDGTVPNSDSPIYTDEGILITGGKTKLRAVCVNQYGKISNELNADFRVNKPYKTFFRDEDDQFKQFVLGQTTYAEMKKNFGDGQVESITDEALMGNQQAIRVTYSWGEARFTQKGEILYFVSSQYASHTGPRNTKVGMRLNEVTELFRDLGQPANAKGNRSIYYDEITGTGKYWQEDKEHGRLEYTYLRPDGGVTTLIYRLKDGIVTSISMGLDGAEL